MPRVLALSLDLDVELAAARRYGVRARPGGPGSRTAGRIGLGETVTWQLRVAGPGLPLHTSRIVELVEDDGTGTARFVDAMDHGLLAAFRHEHVLAPVAGHRQGTLMRDHIRWRSPLGVAGRAADLLFVRHALTVLLRARNAEIARRVGLG